MTKTYCFADKRIVVHSIYEEVHTYCREYETDGPADFDVVTSSEDIEYERISSKKSAEAEGRAFGNPSDAYLEELAVYRKIAEKMPFYDTMLFHGSCIAVDGEGYLFTAPSGTGKSTHARLWMECFPGRAEYINDDKPLIKINREEGSIVYGTPYDGKHRLSSRQSVPLKAIGIIERSMDNHTDRLTADEIRRYYPRLLQQMYRPKDYAALTRSVDLLDGMLLTTPVYRICCNMEKDAAKVAFEAMKS